MQKTITTCDLCGTEIADPDKDMIPMRLPLSEDIRKRIMHSIERKTPKPVMHTPFGAQVIPIENMVAHNYLLQCCPCILGLIPMLAEAVENRINGEIAEYEKQNGARPAGKGK